MTTVTDPLTGAHKNLATVPELLGDPITAGSEDKVDGAGVSTDQRSLAERIQEGDPAAEEALARQYGPRVFLLVLARTHDRELARDQAQETVLAVLTALRQGRLRDGDKLVAFVLGTARHILSNYFRSKQRRPVEVAMAADPPTWPLEDPLENKEKRALVRAAVARLAEREQKVLLLTLVEGLKPHEIALRLRLPAEVVRQCKSRALKKVCEDVRGRWSRR